MSFWPKRALILGESGGIGSALSEALRVNGVEVVGLSRSRDGFDLADPATVDRCLGMLEGTFDLVIVATGILAPSQHSPEKSLFAIEAEVMAEMFKVNAIGPALVLRHIPKILTPDKPTVTAVLTARVGSISDNRSGGWYSYRASKAAANQIVRSAAIEIARKHKNACVVALHPGTVQTAFTSDYPGYEKRTAPVAAAQLIEVMKDLEPQQTGQFLDWAGKRVPW